MGLSGSVRRIGVEPLAVLGREMKPEHKARVIRALYQLGLEQGNVTKDAVAGVLDVAVARGR